MHELIAISVDTPNLFLQRIADQRRDSLDAKLSNPSDQTARIDSLVANQNDDSFRTFLARHGRMLEHEKREKPPQLLLILDP